MSELENTMIMSHTPHGTHRAVRALTLLLALGLFPLGLAGAHAQETAAGTAQDAAYQQLHERMESGELSIADARVIFDAMTPVDWVEKRYAGGVAEIDGAVASERLTAEEGEVRKAKMGESLQSMAFYMEVFNLSAEQAKQKISAEAGKTEKRRGQKKEQAEAGRDDWSWMVERLMKSGVPRENIEGVMGGIKRMVLAMHEQGEAWVIDPHVQEYLTARLGLTESQVEMAVGLSRRASKKPAEKQGLSREDYDKLMAHLTEKGVARDQLREAIAGIEKMAAVMAKKGESFDDAEFRAHFVGLGMTDAQVDEMKMLAARIGAGAKSEGDEISGWFRRFGIGEETVGWLKKELIAAGLTKEQVQPVLGGMLRLIGGMKEQGDAYVLGQRMEQFLIENGLTGVQIDKVVELARRANAKAKKVEPDSEGRERTEEGTSGDR
jgi:hypothetical protein